MVNNSEKNLKLRKKGFTLIELLAVIIILGILMIIAIPSVTSYISDSRKKAYIETAVKYIDGVRVKVNSGDIAAYETDVTYYVPGSCVTMEKGGDSPYGKFLDYYVVVTYNGNGYDYYWTSRDETNTGIYLTHEPLLSTDSIVSGVKEISTAVGVGEREKIKVLGSSCKVEDATETEADVKIDEEATFDGIIPEKLTIYKELQMAAESNNGVKEYTGNGASTFANKVYYYTGEKNNLIFANFCWKIVRTTETGGIKIVYNGVPSADGKCNNTGEATQIGTSAFNSSNNSPAYVGYMYNPTSASNYSYKSKELRTSTGNYKYGNSFTYADGKYKLKEENIKQFSDWGANYNQLSNNHYTCFNETGECTTLSYIYHTSIFSAYYINLTGGKSVEDALKEMLSNDGVNVKDSTIKEKIDAWYETNLKDYTGKLEDAVFCNDRSIYQLNGWDPNGGSITSYLYFGAYGRGSGAYDLTCSNKNDRFTTDASNGNGKLTYQVGLLTSDEAGLVGSSQMKTGQKYWLGSPNYFVGSYDAYGRLVNSDGDLYYGNVGDTGGVRPSVSLKPGTVYRSGDGSTDSPFIVK